MNELQLGVVSGVLIGIVILFLLKKSNNNKNHYDERQLIERGKAYQYGFMTTLAILAVSMFLSMGQVPKWLSPLTLSTVAFTCGLLVFAVYAILKDAFLSARIQSKRMIVLYVLIFLINLFTTITSLRFGESVVGNGCMTVLFGAVLLALAYKKWIVKEEQ